VDGDVAAETFCAKPLLVRGERLRVVDSDNIGAEALEVQAEGAFTRAGIEYVHAAKVADGGEKLAVFPHLEPFYFSFREACIQM
jgi:hypothetical protein